MLKVKTLDERIEESDDMTVTVAQQLEMSRAEVADLRQALADKDLALMEQQEIAQAANRQAEELQAKVDTFKKVIDSLQMVSKMKSEIADVAMDSLAGSQAQLEEARSRIAELDTQLGQRPCRHHRCAEYVALAAQAQAPVAVIPEGYALVPIEPTQAMFNKARTSGNGSSTEKALMASYWRNMIAAAPQQHAQAAQPKQQLYRFDVLDKRNTVLAEGIGVHATTMHEAEAKALKMLEPGESSIRFKSNSPCHPARKCVICNSRPDLSEATAFPNTGGEPDWKGYAEAEAEDAAAPAQPIAGELPEVIDTPEFMDLLNKFAYESSCEEYSEAEYKAARNGIASYIRTYGHQCRAAALESAIAAIKEAAVSDEIFVSTAEDAINTLMVKAWKESH